MSHPLSEGVPPSALQYLSDILYQGQSAEYLSHFESFQQVQSSGDESLGGTPSLSVSTH
ncbi:MAG: hypothetical protein ACE5IR_27980 [bacterium]